jgi:hypothetical protein
MQLPLVYSLPRNPTIKASVAVVMAYYVHISNTTVVSIFVSTETETSSNSITTEVCVLIVDVA